MNTEQAKKLSLPDLLAKLGHSPVREMKGGYELWYRSPFREEAEPSFHTSFIGGKWIWNDFGDEGGTVIDFVMRQQNLSSIKDALAYLDDMFQPGLFSSQAPRPQVRPAPFSFQQQSHRAAVEIFSEDRQLEFIDAQPIRRALILSYLSDERHIPAVLAQRYLQEVRYRNLATGKEYFAFGMENQAGGYEIRVASSKYNFKSALKARDITIIPGTASGRSTVHVFEGMTDFLSFLILNRVEESPDDCIIMHSLSSFHRAEAHIRGQNYQTVKTYLDNDKAGQQGTDRFKATFGAMVLPQGEAFAPHHDLNDLLRAQRSPQKPSSNFRM
ncbi:toprim domain-containing protein [Spirosoma sp. 209]|uniref:toprim domain-containing protein n=1 Tax=Spirosoma sp. 209 TaxID=1955701 RepID=UPI00098D6EF7|nr:toprim domain-containing protein [Spirosoma sp. 209]